MFDADMPPPLRLKLPATAESATNEAANPPDAPQTFAALLASDLLPILARHHVWQMAIFRNDCCRRCSTKRETWQNVLASFSDQAGTINKIGEAGRSCIRRAR